MADDGSDPAAELRRARARAEAAERELDALGFAIAHDLRAPLRSIEGFSQIVLADHAAGLGAAGVEHVERVRAAARRMAALLDDVARLARIAGAPLRPAAVDLSALALAILGEQTPIRDVALAIDDGVVATGDPALLRTLLACLLGNAWKFTGKVAAPAIAFGRSDEDGAAVYFVRDNGAGFDLAQARRLFTPFQRFHAASEFGGNGIGLAIAQRIVHRHGGRIWADAAVGRGATFRFTLA
jgi:light-regulated signal transduction histidine kinase (bacteriophytochrome)